jgi:hypothetical protein
VECTSNTHCTDGAKPNCVNDVCVP